MGPHSLTRGDTLTVPGGSRLIVRNQTGGPILAAIDDRAPTESFTTRLRGIDDDRHLVRLAVTGANHRRQPREAG